MPTNELAVSRQIVRHYIILQAIDNNAHSDASTIAREHFVLDTFSLFRVLTSIGCPIGRCASQHLIVS